MAYYSTCPDCGSNLDPGEKCDCKSRLKREMELAESLFRKEAGSNQMAFDWSGERGKADADRKIS